ncbi:MAG: HNH endonuclease signature motif containing protein [Planctomycetaceae bacterium]
MSEYVPAALCRLVRERANQCCEYCQIHEDDAFLPHEPDHVIAVRHGGETLESNLAWTCFVCNRAKGSDLSSVDNVTGQIVRLFNRRSDLWNDHFRMEPDGRMLPQTEIGRVTEFLFKLNRAEAREIRRTLTNSRRKPK